MHSKGMPNMEVSEMKDNNYKALKLENIGGREVYTCYRHPQIRLYDENLAKLHIEIAHKN